MDLVNHQLRLAARPHGLPEQSDWELAEQPVADPGEGEAVVQILFISLDPAMRGWMNEGRSYVPPVQIGEVMRAFAAGKVVASNDPAVAVGDDVVGLLGAQEYAVVSAKALTKVDTQIAPLQTFLGTLGMPGMTAYFGMFEIGKPQPGQTVVVSGAAGAVGGVVGQLAKLEQARAVGIAGGPEKCAYIVQELGYDAAIDYKSQDVAAGLGEHCPDGIDVFFDNVGGNILDAALAHLAREARVVLCGAISQYNSTDGFRGPANYMSLLVNHATMTGFVFSDYFSKVPEAGRELDEWYAAGKLKSREDIAEGGVAALPQTMLRLFTGDHLGKLVLRVGEQ